MRLFIAIPLPDQIKARLQKLQQTLPKDIRAQPAEQMHITLYFLGETTFETAKMVKNKLAEIEVPKFSLLLKGVGTFPQKGKLKIIWAGVQQNNGLMFLHNKIEKVCIGCGFEPENRAYIPHITLGKVKKASSSKIKNWIKKTETEINIEINTNSFILYESVFTEGVVIHNPFAKYGLI